MEPSHVIFSKLTEHAALLATAVGYPADTFAVVQIGHILQDRSSVQGEH